MDTRRSAAASFVPGCARLAVIASVAVLLAMAWRLSHASAYVLLPEPYRYCFPPSGVQQTKAPTSVDHTLELEDGGNPAMDETTDEQFAQAQLLAAKNSFVVPAGATQVRVQIRCVAPPAVAPLGGRLDGNVYHFAVSAGTVPLSVRPGQVVTLLLRGPAGAPNPVLEIFSKGGWRRLDTQPLGMTSPDAYATNATSLGDLALVVAQPADLGGGGSRPTGLLAGAVAACVVVAGAAGVLVLRRRSSTAPRRAEGRRR